ncbi:uncharacterized protein [Asterias amurensis]|uniref:uncharacterized protein n=1 Tax=Asterias amurensis TaxID=7602 RepID=UPI003AB29762
MKEKHRRRKGRTWADAAKTVLERQTNTPMSSKEILKNIQKSNLKDISGIVPSACLNAVLHGGSRGPDGMFYKVGDMMGVYGLRSHLPDEVKLMLEFRVDDSVDTSGTQDAAENAGTETGISKPGAKKMLCYLPEKAHNSVPALRHFTLSSASSSSAVAGHAPMRAVSEAEEHHHHHHHRAKGLKATSQMHSPTKLKFTLHHKHRRKQQIVPRIILKPLKSPPGKEPNYAAEVIDLTPSPSDNEMDQQSLPDDTDIDTDTTKDDNSENIQGITDNHSSIRQSTENTNAADTQPSVSTNPLGLKDNPTTHNPTNIGDSFVASVTTRSQITRDDKTSLPSLSNKSEPPPASRVSQRISMRQAMPLQTQTRSQTMSKLMANVPGFSGKPRNREKKFSVISKLHPPKKMSLHVDLETPDSILANVNLKALINKHTFNSLPAHYQYKLLTLLPGVDRVHTNDNFIKMFPSALDNEFFARACSKWRERLSSGEFTPESQQRLRQEMDKDRNKLDPWKAKHFEPSWGQSMLATAPEIPESFASMGVIPPEERKAPAMHTRSSAQRKTSSSNAVSTVYRNTRSATSGGHHHYHKLGYDSSSRHHRGLSSRESKRLQKHEKERELKYRSSSELKSIPKEETLAKDSNLRSVIADINVKQSSSGEDLSSTPTNFSCSSLLSSMAMESQRHQVAASLATLSSSSLPIMQHAEASPLKRPSEGKVDVQEKRLCRNDDAIEVLESYGESSRPSSNPSSMSLLTAISCSNSPHLQMSQSSTENTPDAKTKLLTSVKSPMNAVKQGHHTRTLAQIKAQTQARAQAHGQTRTLAQIKKQTTAKLLARSVAQAEAQSQAKVTGHVPTILGRPRSQHWNTLKAVNPVSALSTSVASSSSVIQASSQDTVKQQLQNNVLHVAVSNQQVVQTIPSFYIKAQPGSGSVSVVYVTQPDAVTLVPASAAALQQMNNKSPSPAKQVLTPQTSSSQKVLQMLPQPKDLPISNAANFPQRPKSISSILNMRNAESQKNNASLTKKVKSEDGTGKVLPNGTCLGVSNAIEPSLSQSTSKTQSTELNFSVLSGGNTAAFLENKVSLSAHQPLPTMVLGAQAVPADAIKLLAKGNVQLDPFSCRPTPGVVLQRVDMPANGRESGDSLDVSPGKCSCRLGAMVICKGCGAFCHDDCISSTSLCMACVVR